MSYILVKEAVKGAFQGGTIEGANQEAHQGQLLQAFDVSPNKFQFEGFQGQFKEHFKGYLLEQYLKKHFK